MGQPIDIDSVCVDENEDDDEDDSRNTADAPPPTFSQFKA
jgi:hypothetical protein